MRASLPLLATALAALLAGCGAAPAQPDVVVVPNLRTLSVDVTVTASGPSTTTRLTPESPILAITAAPGAATICVAFRPVGSDVAALRRFSAPSATQKVTVGEANGAVTITGDGRSVASCP